ncbi:PilN domain-containing protein [Ideonella sp. DXS29W]|uniref:PilN domain-containing protein n=1 Tax=Ideonella lacteola TaxID=2984193 RepID=A0ABU9BSK2_9BURK
MILINLLPHREARRQERKRAFFSALGLAAIVGVGLTILWFGILQQMTSFQESRNRFLADEIKKLDEQIKDIAALRAEIEALRARQKAVEDLQTDRNVPVYLLDELVKQTPEGIYLTSVKQNGNVVTVGGMSQTNERVSEMLRNTAYNSPWLEKPELVEIKAVTLGKDRDARRLFDFSMRVSIKRPQGAAGAASGASGASTGAANPASAPAGKTAKAS